MQFTELEKIMSQRGITSLTDIACALNTTTQTVSDWKYSNHVPSHIITKLEEITFADNSSVGNSKSSVFNAPGQTLLPPYIGNDAPSIENDITSFLKFLFTMAEQLKVVVLVAFITTFLVTTYVQFFQHIQYRSSSNVVLSTFTDYVHDSVIMPPSLEVYPKLLRSEFFTERIMDKEFYTEKFGKKLPLFAIFTHGDNPPKKERGILIQQATEAFSGCIQISHGILAQILTIDVIADEPLFAKELAEVILVELEALHRSFTEGALNGKSEFLEKQTVLAKEFADNAKQKISEFNEQNQVLSPSSRREYEMLIDRVKSTQHTYASLKMEAEELANSKSIFQKKTVMEIIEHPVVNLTPYNKDLKRKVVLAGILGVGLGILIGLVRSTLCNINNDTEPFKKLNQLIKEGAKDSFLDWRVSGILSVFLLAGSPYYLGCEPRLPVLFGITYVMTILAFICLSIYLYRRNIKSRHV